VQSAYNLQWERNLTINRKWKRLWSWKGLLEYFLIFCGLQSIAGFGFNKKKRVDVVVINLMMLRPNNCGP
jgi:transposase